MTDRIWIPVPRFHGNPVAVQFPEDVGVCLGHDIARIFDEIYLPHKKEKTQSFISDEVIDILIII